MRSQRNTWSASAGSANSANARGKPISTSGTAAQAVARPAGERAGPPDRAARHLPGDRSRAATLWLCQTTSRLPRAGRRSGEGAAGEGRPVHLLGLPRDHLQRVRAGPPARLRRRRGDGGHRPGGRRHRRGGEAARLPRRPGAGDPLALPADHPAGLGHRSVGQAGAVGRGRPPARRRRRRGAPAVPLAARVRPGLRRRRPPAHRADRHLLLRGEHVPLAHPGGRAQGLHARLGPDRARLRRPDPRLLPRLDGQPAVAGPGRARGATGCGTST